MARTSTAAGLLPRRHPGGVGQRVQVGFPHRDSIVTIEVEDTVLRVLDQHNHVLKVVPRTNTKEVTRYKAYGVLSATLREYVSGVQRHRA
jgi:hypothetical protein